MLRYQFGTLTHLIFRSNIVTGYSWFIHIISNTRGSLIEYGTAALRFSTRPSCFLKKNVYTHENTGLLATNNLTWIQVRGGCAQEQTTCRNGPEPGGVNRHKTEVVTRAWDTLTWPVLGRVMSCTSTGQWRNSTVRWIGTNFCIQVSRSLKIAGNDARVGLPELVISDEI